MLVFRRFSHIVISLIIKNKSEFPAAIITNNIHSSFIVFVFKIFDKNEFSCLEVFLNPRQMHPFSVKF